MYGRFPAAPDVHGTGFSSPCRRPGCYLAVRPIGSGYYIDQRGFAGAIRADQTRESIPVATRKLTSDNATRPPKDRVTLFDLQSCADNRRQGHRSFIWWEDWFGVLSPVCRVGRQNQTHDSVWEKIKGNQNQTGVDDEPVFVEIVQHLGQQHQHSRADRPARNRAGAAEQHCEQEEHRAEELKIVGTDVILLMREQCAAEACERRTDDEDDTFSR